MVFMMPPESLIHIASHLRALLVQTNFSAVLEILNDSGRYAQMVSVDSKLTEAARLLLILDPIQCFSQSW